MPTMKSAPTAAPTPMPALAPADNRLGDDAGGAGGGPEDVGRAVDVADELEEVCVPVDVVVVYRLESVAWCATTIGSAHIVKTPDMLVLRVLSNVVNPPARAATMVEPEKVLMQPI